MKKLASLLTDKRLTDLCPPMDIASLNYALFAQSNRLTIREDNLFLHATHHAPSIVSRGRLDKVYIKVDKGERQKTLKIRLKRIRDRGGV